LSYIELGSLIHQCMCLQGSTTCEVEPDSDVEPDADSTVYATEDGERDAIMASSDATLAAAGSDERDVTVELGEADAADDGAGDDDDSDYGIDEDCIGDLGAPLPACEQDCDMESYTDSASEAEFEEAQSDSECVDQASPATSLISDNTEWLGAVGVARQQSHDTKNKLLLWANVSAALSRVQSIQSINHTSELTLRRSLRRVKGAVTHKNGVTVGKRLRQRRTQSVEFEF